MRITVPLNSRLTFLHFNHSKPTLASPQTCDTSGKLKYLATNKLQLGGMTWSNSTPIADILHQVAVCVFNKIKLLWYITCFYKPQVI